MEGGIVALGEIVPMQLQYIEVDEIDPCQVS
jgi:hypothetical protein